MTAKETEITFYSFNHARDDFSNKMNANTKTDEKYPLLYLIVDKDDGISCNNRKFFERRGGITAGASNILEQWPGKIFPPFFNET